jgi:hypothetical protein
MLAGAGEIETEYKPDVIETPIKVTTYCQDGYKFLIVQSHLATYNKTSTGVAVVQMFRDGVTTNTPQPIKCEEK